MGPRIERRQRGWSLTRRLIVALSIGAFFVAVVLGFLGADREQQRQVRATAAAEQALASSLAERAAPLLERDDVMRLSVLAAVGKDQAGGRVMVLDRDGRVVVDSSFALGDQRLSLLATTAPIQRTTEIAAGTSVRESLAAVRFGGEVIGEVRVQCQPRAVAAGFDMTWFGLVLLSCLTLVAAAAMLGHHWSTRVRGATDALIRIAAGEVGGASPEGDERELQDLGSAMRELEKGMQDGLERVGHGYLQMALRLIDGLEERRLVPPGHGERTARFAGRLAERLQLLQADREELATACRLVDLGKASLRSSLLQRQDPLTDEESESLAHHPVLAAEQIECVPGLRRIAKILRHQAERYDGRGAPDGLRGDRIPLGSRVLAVASTFDLLTTCGVDKPLEWQQALARLQELKGEVFDAWLVDLFAEEIHKDPPVASDRDVMIVPAGALPFSESGETEDDDDDVSSVAQGDLEVMFDDFPFEDKP